VPLALSSWAVRRLAMPRSTPLPLHIPASLRQVTLR
jgi:hypothetical protein